VANFKVVEGPATIKSEKGLLRNDVRLNVRGRGESDFVDQARRVVAERVRLPEATHVEWTGQFEREPRARRALQVILPIVIVRQEKSTFTRPDFTHGNSANDAQSAGSSASSMSMFGMSSLIANRGPHWVQIKVSPSRRRGAFPIGQTSRAIKSSLTISGLLIPSETRHGCAVL
jgi:hypothetical protein